MARSSNARKRLESEGAASSEAHGKSGASKKGRVVKLPPTAPAARDEGPRLIPLPPGNRMALEPPRVKHYLDLAEKALKAGKE